MDMHVYGRVTSTFHQKQEFNLLKYLPRFLSELQNCSDGTRTGGDCKLSIRQTKQGGCIVDSPFTRFCELKDAVKLTITVSQQLRWVI